MAQMKRILNLEEVGSDAFLGVPVLNYQTLGQKIIFFGSVGCTIVAFLYVTFVLQINANLSVFVSFLPLLLGVLFGGNHNQDLSIAQYLYLMIKKPETVLTSKSTEDPEQIRAVMDDIKRRDEEMLNAKENGKKLIIKLIVTLVLILLVVVIAITVILSSKKGDVHHTVDAIEEVGSIVRSMNHV